MTTTREADEFDLSALEDSMDPNAAKAKQLADAKAKIAGTTPLVPDPPDCIVNLPRGLWHNGSWKKEAEVRELTGADEEALSRTKESNDFFDLVIAHGVVRLDDIAMQNSSVAERQGTLRGLLIGERSQLLLAILIATYGSEKLLNVTCNNCQLEQEISLLLKEDFKPKVVEDVAAPSFTYTTTKGDLIEYRLVTGNDQAEALRRKGATIAESNTLILSRCINKVNDQMVLDSLQYARQLGMKDRLDLLNEMTSRQPDLDLSIQTPCLGCGGDIILALGWSDLFRS